MDTVADLQTIADKIKPILAGYPITYAGFFGSYARGEATAESDLDILVRFSKPVSLLDLIGLEQDISDMLKTDVDVVTEGGISPHIRPYILHDLNVFYGTR